MVDTVMERTGFQKNEIAMVGDRLSTDIAFGTRNGILAILVLTGEATLADVERGPVKPDIILPHAKEILKYLCTDKINCEKVGLWCIIDS